MKKFFTLMLFASCVFANSQAQTTTIIQPSNGDDCNIRMLDSTSPFFASNPYAGAIDSPGFNTDELTYMAWTFSSCPGWTRSLMHFPELSNIGTHSNVLSATLTLRGVPSSGNFGNSNYSGSPYPLTNEGSIFALAASYNPHTVTWRTQPGYVATDSVVIPVSTNHWSDSVTLDITNLVKHLITNGNHGLLLRTSIEVKYRERVFASSKNSDASLHPTLKVVWTKGADVPTLSKNIISCITYPNPAKNVLNADISISLPSNVGMQIFDMTGRKLYNEQKQLIQGTNHVCLPIENLSTGLYILEISDGVNVERQRFSKL